MTAACTRCKRVWIVSIKTSLAGYVCPDCDLRQRYIASGVIVPMERRNQFMLFYRITVTAEREQFMERPLRDTSEHCVAAYSSDIAVRHVEENLRRGGWKIIQIRVKEEYLYDTRDRDDQVTY